METYSLSKFEQLTQLLKDVMDIGIMFIICILVVSCFVYYLWKLRPKMEESKQVIIENNQKILDSFDSLNKLLINSNQIFDKLKESIDYLNVNLTVNNDKLNSINTEVLLLRRDINDLKIITNELKILLKS